VQGERSAVRRAIVCRPARVAAAPRTGADSARVVSPAGRTVGKPALVSTLTQRFGAPSAPSAPRAPRAPLHVTRRKVAGPIGCIDWVQNEGKPEQFHGSDRVVVPGRAGPGAESSPRVPRVLCWFAIAVFARSP